LNRGPPTLVNDLSGNNEGSTFAIGGRDSILQDVLVPVHKIIVSRHNACTIPFFFMYISTATIKLYSVSLADYVHGNGNIY
jgi:hypothetical protein